MVRVSSAPTGQPTREPTGQPTGQPTGNKNAQYLWLRLFTTNVWGNPIIGAMKVWINDTYSIGGKYADLVPRRALKYNVSPFCRIYEFFGSWNLRCSNAGPGWINYDLTGIEFERVEVSFSYDTGNCGCGCGGGQYFKLLELSHDYTGDLVFWSSLETMKKFGSFPIPRGQFCNKFLTFYPFGREQDKRQRFLWRGSDPGNALSQAWTVPPNVKSLTVEAYGAMGGNLGGYYGRAPQKSGIGGYIKAIVPVVPGQVLYVYVGTRGRSGFGGTGNWNGGGPSEGTGCGGGGATDIRTIEGDLSSRLVVAGGGGGQPDGCNYPNTANGGDGGGLIGAPGTVCYGILNQFPGLGGNQTAGGYTPKNKCPSAATSGSFGQGGYGRCGGGGGGGGWYGGGASEGAISGAGGSSYACPDCNIIENVQGGATQGAALYIKLNCIGGFILAGSYRCVPEGTINFVYNGMVQNWVVPAKADSITVDLYGAQGGKPMTQTSLTGGGLGGCISVTKLPIAPGQLLYIVVGGNGDGSVTGGVLDGFVGFGYNGGGRGLPSAFNPTDSCSSFKCQAGWGGGATDIRTNASDLLSRLAVAGGGGGAGGSVIGGSGGGMNASAGLSVLGGGGGAGGSQSQGGLNVSSTDGKWWSTAGTLGNGGIGSFFGGGGGGGYYGGAGGVVDSGGGGGSNFAVRSASILADQRGCQGGFGLVSITISSCSQGLFPFAKGCVSLCPAGYYRSDQSCLACGIGTFSTLQNQTSILACTTCPAGYATSRVGQTTCDTCGAGKYSPFGNIQPTCLLCPAGKYQDKVGQSLCENCPDGSYNTAVGLGLPADSSCNVCRIGRHSSTDCDKSIDKTDYPESCSTGTPTGPVGGGTCCTISRAPPPTAHPSPAPTGQPTSQPTTQPILRPTSHPSRQPSCQPSRFPTGQPSTCPSDQPTSRPSRLPTTQPSRRPSHQPSTRPSTHPTSIPTTQPISGPTAAPTLNPTRLFSAYTDTPFEKQLTFPKIYGAETQRLEFHNLGALDRRWYLEVQVYDTGFSENSFIEVLLTTGLIGNGKTRSAVSQCSPPQITGDYSAENCKEPLALSSYPTPSSAPLNAQGWFTCNPENILVTKDMISAKGGSLIIEVTPSGTFANACSYNGNQVIVKILLKSVLPFPTSAPLSSFYLSESVLTMVMTGSNPIYILVACASGFVAFAIVLLFLRNGDCEVAQISPFGFILGMMLTGSSLASECILVSVLLTSEYTYQILGSVIVIGRVLHIVPSLYFHLALNGPQYFSKHYVSMISESQMLRFSFFYGLLALLTLFETSLFRTFPWLSTRFALRSGGFPDLFMFQISTWSKVLQSIVTVTCQLYFVVDINRQNVQTAKANAKVFFIIGLVTTFCNLVLSLYEVVMRTTMLKKVFASMEATRELELSWLETRLSQIQLSALPDHPLQRIVISERHKNEELSRRLEAVTAELERMKSDHERSSSMASMTSRSFEAQFGIIRAQPRRLPSSTDENLEKSEEVCENTNPMHSATQRAQELGMQGVSVDFIPHPIS